MFDRREMQRTRAALRTRWPDNLVREMDRVGDRLGRYGVRIARTLVSVDTGQTRSLITYSSGVRRRNGRTDYHVRVYVDSDRAPNPRDAAIRAFVTEFGRGHGAGGVRARGRLQPRPFLRPSRELVSRRAQGSFSGAMRRALRDTFST